MLRNQVPETQRGCLLWRVEIKGTKVRQPESLQLLMNVKSVTGWASQKPPKVASRPVTILTVEADQQMFSDIN